MNGMHNEDLGAAAPEPSRVDEVHCELTAASLDYLRWLAAGGSQQAAAEYIRRSSIDEFAETAA